MEWMRPCYDCGTRIPIGKNGQRRYCDTCRHHRRRVSSLEWLSRNPSYKPVRRPPRFRVGAACTVTFGACPECQALCTYRRPHQRFCSDLHARRWHSREYQRKTHVTAIRYWRIANTQEAQDLAETMFALRQEMRKRSVPLSPK